LVNPSFIATVESLLPNITPKTKTDVDPLLGIELLLGMKELMFGAL
jgi:hypothetical protein